MAVARAIWWFEFARLAANPRRSKFLSQLKKNLHLSTDERVRRLGAAQEKAAAIHQATIEQFFTSRMEALTLGALALAAWAALVTQPLTELDEYTLRILFVGVVLTLSGPVLFRQAGTEGTRMGLATMVALGYAGVIISLSSMLAAVFQCDALHAVGIALTVAVVGREVLEIRTELGFTRQLFR